MNGMIPHYDDPDPPEVIRAINSWRYHGVAHAAGHHLHELRRFVAYPLAKALADLIEVELERQNVLPIERTIALYKNGEIVAEPDPY